ncbi:MAG TPA: glutamate synthase-related protein [Terriglobia bacterium]|nr:glutamate synthase-related protein [Terriglobia bacterium]
MAGFNMYQRYHLETISTPEIAPFPNRTRVKVQKRGLATHLIKELIRYRGNRAVALSRPCLYGVFSGPVGGFAPRSDSCVACLRCTVEYPEMVQVCLNPEHLSLGDSYFTPGHVDTVCYEARTGRVPVKGAGYRGRFGGEGWDGMWTDMSEIVRPTRDGIHGREFISTSVDIGQKPPFLTFDKQGVVTGRSARTFSMPIPVLFDVPPPSALSPKFVQVLVSAAQKAKTLVVLPVGVLKKFKIDGQPIVPLVNHKDANALEGLRFTPPMIELEGWNETLFREILMRFADSAVCLRRDFLSKEDLSKCYHSGVRVFHLTANYHGRGRDGRFVLDLIREVHGAFLEAGCRDEVTLLGSGGIIAAEHVPKAIICGLDAVALDTAPLAALQARFLGECLDRESRGFQLPRRLSVNWGVQRIENLLASWRDQLLEVLGAMGLREVRRLRGEIGRAMFQKNLEREAFAGIKGYDH